MRKFLSLMLLILAIVAFGRTNYMVHDRFVKASDSYARQATVLLKGAQGSCSGVQVKSEKKGLYVLTAAHCRPLLTDGKIRAISEDQKETILEFVAEDDKSDLMLLTGSAIFGSVDVSETAGMYEKVHTITHGGGIGPAYRTDGEALNHMVVGFVKFVIHEPSDIDMCMSQAKNTIEPSFDGMSITLYCVSSFSELRSTAPSIPGSSGGPLLNERGELVGIVSCGNPQQPMFSYYVTLSDVRAFLSASMR